MKLIQNSKLEAVRQRVAGTVPPQTPAVPCDRAADVLGCAHGLRANTCGGLGKRRQAPSSLSLSAEEQLRSASRAQADGGEN